MSFDYRIAIPSYDRPEAVRTKTLAMLDSLNVDRDRVVVVCATPNEQERYLASLGNGWRTEVASLGLVNAREWYHGHFAEGTRILNIDDDVEAIMVKHGKKVERYEGCIDDIAEDGFSQCEAARARLWGIYPVDNGLFMNDQTVVGLRFICGVFFGSYAGDPVFSHRRGSNDDWESTLQSFTSYGAVVRLEYLSVRTRYLLQAVSGGVAAQLGSMEARLVHREALIREVCRRYPQLATTYWKSGDVLNVRLKRIDIAKISKHNRREFVGAMQGGAA